MTLRHMKIFATVCKENSVTGAAKKLYISQPAVSNAIKELESYYGVPLFDRISKRLFLTQAGELVYNYSLHINSLFEELEATIKASETIGKLRVGSSITIGTHFLPMYIKEFMRKFPDIQVFATVDSSDIIENMIVDNELDIALIEGLIHSDSIISKDFIKDELVVICDIDNPLLHKKVLSISDLSSQKFLMRERNSGSREFAESILLIHNIAITPIWESSSTEAIIQGVANGIGISILPAQLVQDAIDRNIVAKVKITGLDFKRQYHIIYHKNKFLTNAATEFVSLCSSKKDITE